MNSRCLHAGNIHTFFLNSRQEINFGTKKTGNEDKIRTPTPQNLAVQYASDNFPPISKKISKIGNGLFVLLSPT